MAALYRVVLRSIPGAPERVQDLPMSVTSPTCAKRAAREWLGNVRPGGTTRLEERSGDVWRPLGVLTSDGTGREKWQAAR